MFVKFNLVIFFNLIGICLYSQTDEVLFKVDRKEITKKEFIRAFSKNNNPEWIHHRDSVKKFLDYYIDYKLKIVEAEAIGLNKQEKFIRETEGYKLQLAKEFLVDEDAMDYFVKQSFERGKTEIRIRQILVRIDPNAAPKDSLLAYQKALNFRKKIINGGNFAEIATQYSDDPRAAINGGDLWYVKPFMVPYAVENYIYSNTPEKVSLPVRSNLGYHIIEIVDKRPARGRFKVAHILLEIPESRDDQAENIIKQRIDSIYHMAVSGANFAQLALTFSDDKGTSANGGELPWFDTGKMPIEFENETFNLSFDGAISKPVRTVYGWHIIRRISQQENPMFDQAKEQLYNMVLNSEKGKLAQLKKIKTLKSSYHFTDYNALSPVMAIVDSSIYEASWKIPLDVDLSGKLFSFDNLDFYQKDFALFLEHNQKISFPIPLINYISSMYEDYINSVIIEHEEEKIEKTNHKFSLLLDEFKEGILYNEVMAKEIWNKTSTDKGKLNDFYQKNKDTYNNLFIADVCIYSYHTDKPAKLEKQFEKLKELDLPDTEIEKEIQNALDDGFVFIKCIKKEEGQDNLVDECINQYKAGKITENQRIIDFTDSKTLVWLNKKISKTNKPLEEITDVISVDFLNYIEKSWISELKAKYRVTVFEDVLESLNKN